MKCQTKFNLDGSTLEIDVFKMHITPGLSWIVHFCHRFTLLSLNSGLKSRVKISAFVLCIVVVCDFGF